MLVLMHVRRCHRLRELSVIHTGGPAQSGGAITGAPDLVAHPAMMTAAAPASGQEINAHPPELKCPGTACRFDVELLGKR